MATSLVLEGEVAKKQRREQLSEKQREIMEVVWELGEASVFEVRDELAKKREVARNTVRTMMERLEERGWLTHRVIGRTHFYSALVDRQDNLGHRVVDMVDKVCGGSPENLMSALLEFRGLSGDEISRIEKMLKDAKRREKK
ncbi:MAG: BlaI/MecI/CopY family transcriptional regulator [Planctomycetota bacterium]